MAIVLRCLLCDAQHFKEMALSFWHMLTSGPGFRSQPELIVVINVSGLVSFKAGAHIRSHQVD